MKPRTDRMTRKRKIAVFNPSAGTFHEAIEFTYHIQYNGVRLPIRVDPRPYPHRLITIDRWKQPAPMVAWLFTGGCGEVISVQTTPTTQTHYEKLVRNNEPSIQRFSRFRHIDGNPMNCRRDNLELLERRPYQAVTSIGGVRVSLGSYATPEDALQACNDARAAVGMGPVKTRRTKCATS